MSGYWQAIFAASRGIADTAMPVAELLPLHRFVDEEAGAGFVELETDTAAETPATAVADRVIPSSILQPGAVVTAPTNTGLSGVPSAMSFDAEPFQTVDRTSPSVGQAAPVALSDEREGSTGTPQPLPNVEGADVSRPPSALPNAVSRENSGREMTEVRSATATTALPDPPPRMTIEQPLPAETPPVLPVQATTPVETSIATPMAVAPLDAVPPMEPQLQPHPIVISIDRIDIRVGGDIASPSSSPLPSRRPTPVIGLDEFLRRSGGPVA